MVNWWLPGGTPRELYKSLLSEESRTQWELKLLALKVQGKALEAIDLEKENKVWKRIAGGLPSGQLSFILGVCSDTLPTQVKAKCKLCDSGNATIRHILNGCPEALSGGRYSWRHDCVLKYLANSLKKLCLTWSLQIWTT